MKKNVFISAVSIAALTAACAKKADPENKAQPPPPVQTTQTIPAKTSDAPTNWSAPVPLTKPTKDFVREHLNVIAETVKDPEQKKKNKEFAQSIQSVNFVIDQNKNVQITVVAKYGDAIKKSTGEGKLSTQGDAEISGSVSGEFVCISKDGGCQTAVLKLKTGGDSSKTVARVILRKTNFVISKFQFTDQVSKNENILNWINVARKTMNSNKDSKGFFVLNYDSFEVSGGASAARLVLVTGDGEIVQLKMGLNEISGKKNIAVGVDASITLDEALEIRGQESFSTKLSESIDTARLKRNDGDGKIEIQVNLKKNEDRSKDHFDIIVERSADAVDLSLIR